MNKEIEFRIYDKKNEVMNYMDLCDLAAGDDYWFNGETGVWNAIYDSTHEQKNFIIQKYISLKDKNGKKIFEGDIVRCKLIDQVKKNGKWVDKVTYENYEVIYDNEDLGFKFKDEWQTIWKFKACELEVIGTIFDKENNNE